MNQKRKIGKSTATWFMCLAMVLTTVNLPAFTISVKAAEESAEAMAPSVTAFAMKEDLVNPDNFTLHKDNGSGVAEKVNFGNGKTWYIAGTDKDGSLVLMCDPLNMFDYRVFLAEENYDSTTYINNEKYEEIDVYANHYGASDIRKYLNGDALNVFTEKEKLLITAPVVYTNDMKNRCTYATSDKLYLAYGYKDSSDDQYITVGSNSDSNLNNGIKIGIKSSNGTKGSPYTTKGGSFWLRETYGNPYLALITYLNHYLNAATVNSKESVAPVFNMNLSSVLFASTATVASSDATLSDAMTFRINGKEVIKSKAKVYYDRVQVTKGTASDEYIYIQYNEGGTDKVVSEKIEYDRSLNSSKYNLDNFENCKIWIEKYDETSNLTYAVMAEIANVVVDNNLIFEIVHNDVTGKDEATLIRFVRKYYQDATEVEAIIPSYVEKGGVKYTVTKIGDVAFDSMKKMTNVYIPDTVIEMGTENCFHNCENLQTVRLSNNMNKLPANAFGFCKKLTAINIPNTWDEIPGELFYTVSTLSEITIPKSVKRIGKNAFLGVNPSGGMSVIYGGSEEEWATLMDNANCAEGNDALKAANVINKVTEEITSFAITGFSTDYKLGDVIVDDGKYKGIKVDSPQAEWISGGWVSWSSMDGYCSDKEIQDMDYFMNHRTVITDSNARFETGQIYVGVISFVASLGTEFSKDVEITLNGKPVSFLHYKEGMEDWIDVLYILRCTPDLNIEYVNPGFGDKPGEYTYSPEYRVYMNVARFNKGHGHAAEPNALWTNDPFVFIDLGLKESQTDEEKEAVLLQVTGGRVHWISTYEENYDYEIIFRVESNLGHNVNIILNSTINGDNWEFHPESEGMESIPVCVTPHTHEGGTATCIKKAKCTKCGKEYGKLAEHTLKTTTTKATLTADGKKETKCTVCGKVTKTTKIYAAKTIKLSKTAYTYDGKAKKPTVTIKDSKGKAIATTNYSVKYDDGRKNVGKYNVKITFKGDYKGSKTLTFTINPKATTLKSVTPASKAFTAKWTKQTKQVDGYEVEYALDKNFTSSAKKVEVNKNTTTSKQISSLKSKKTYYVRVRTYKKVGTKKYYSDWSKTLNVKTK